MATARQPAAYGEVTSLLRDLAPGSLHEAGGPFLCHEVGGFAFRECRDS
jgi:hypothetical protein